MAPELEKTMSLLRYLLLVVGLVGCSFSGNVDPDVQCSGDCDEEKTSCYDDCDTTCDDDDPDDCVTTCRTDCDTTYDDCTVTCTDAD